MATPRLLLLWMALASVTCQGRRPGDRSAIADLRRLNLNATRGAPRNRSSIDILRKTALEAPSVATPGKGSAVCDFEGPCSWVATPDQHGFRVVTGRNVSGWKGVSGPTEDASGDPDGHFLYLSAQKDSKEAGYHVYVKKFGHVQAKNCFLKFMFHAHNIKDGMLTIYSEGNVSHPVHSNEVHIADFKKVANNSWVQIRQYIGSPKQNFQIVLEVLRGPSFPFHAAYDNITFENCFPDPVIKTPCSGRSFECMPGTCVDMDRVCDITMDCPNGNDEKHQCDQMKNFNAYCDFEHGMCGWTNNRDDDFEWQLESNKTLQDHTFKNKSGHYMYLSQTRKTTLGKRGILTSAVFPPPPRSHRDIHSPHFNSCQVRFYYRMSGTVRHALELNLVELKPLNSSQFELWRAFKMEQDWQRVTTVLPHLRHRYQIQFSGSEGLGRMEHIAIDDVTLSPECFGIGLSDVNGSNWYKFNTCGATGRHGPTSVQCKSEYGNATEVTMVDSGPLAGIQQWIVPETGIYSVFIKGASGGLGSNNKRPSKAASARGVFNWSKGEVIYVLVGQEGVGATQASDTGNCTENTNSRGIGALSAFLKKCPPVVGGGGGGGGATYVFKKNEYNESVPLLVAAGGGGLGTKMRPGSANPDGRAWNKTISRDTNGKGSSHGAGGGGGWKGSGNSTTAGRSLFQGAVGGAPCNGSEQWKTEGGFGGGGGPCLSGGGGGGYAGGDAMVNDTVANNGQGGTSYASGTHASTEGNSSQGPGSAVIVPAFVGCGCDYLCVMLNLENSSYMCICEDGYTLEADNSTCAAMTESIITKPLIMEHLIIVIPIITIIIICVATVMFFLYQRYQRQTAQPIGPHVVASHPELQLNRLRPVTGGGMVTEYNPNYEFGGSTCTIQDLREVQRENLSLVKALGQGAFGEVYQGYLSNVPGELRDVPVAIKTLPEVSSNQAEMDFLMEALIMSKFTHPNIVRFIGVCFEKLPKFIVLELLPGGDLKSFLRESRPKPEKPSPLTMRDLLMLAIDVAKGCHYLEENHFIHRDIAARNCLLTTKDVTRVVKIADFGMARDIYRADYYRKGGKAMLPVKWMPPEAFLDGIFTSKTDVWSFGVLLWEVMSLGYMPYPGRGNQDVMQLVTSGGRLEPPNNCPLPVYHIMSQCWNPKPEERPNFITILERLGYCFQDPDVTSAPLPVFHCPPSAEHDATIMRSTDPDSVCLHVQRGEMDPQSPASTDYLIPIPSSSYSLCTEKTELQSASSLESVDRLLELDDKGDVPLNPVTSPLIAQPATVALPPLRGPGNWETSFMKGEPVAWSGDYQSIPTQEVPLSAIPPPESSPARRSPPSAIARQRPSVKKPAGPFFPELDSQTGAINKVPLPLDPATLSKQHQAQVLPYANVAVPSAAEQRTTQLAGAPRNEPYTITAPRGAAPPSNKGKYDKDIQC